MFLHLALDYLSIALLNSLKILLSLRELSLPILDQGLSRLNFQLDMFHNLGYYIDLGGTQVVLIYASSAEELVLIRRTQAYFLNLERVNQLPTVLRTGLMGLQLVGRVDVNQLLI
jgi:hypothetical protein